MANVTSLEKNGTLFISIEGRIDSSNADETEGLINEILANNPNCELVIDAEKLEYISSAGLRIILRLRKKFPEMKIINVSADVYEIFDMTGFAEILTIEKAYRKISVDGCEVIGRGANGEVYRLDSDTIVKVYFKPDALPDILRERALARKAFVLGVPTAISYDVVKVGEGYGSVFELLNSNSLKKLLIKFPDNIDEYATMFVDLLKTIHSTEVKPEDMPDMREIAIGWVDYLEKELPEATWKKLHSLVEAVPTSHKMIHGDYHVGNVMLQNGETLLIDMDTLAQGNAVFEFASIFNAFKGFSIIDNTIVEKFLGIKHEIALKMWDLTIRKYFGTDDEAKLAEIEDKSAVIGYVRLLRRTIRRDGKNNDEGRNCIEFYKKSIIELVDRLDSIEL